VREGGRGREREEGGEGRDAGGVECFSSKFSLHFFLYFNYPVSLSMHTDDGGTFVLTGVLPLLSSPVVENHI